MKTICLLLLSMLACGCGSYFTNAGHDLTAGAMQEATSDTSKHKLTELTTSAVRGARDEALGSTTDADLRKLVASLGASLQIQLKVIVAQVLDELLGTNAKNKIAGLREELVGAPLRADLDSLIAEEVPKLTLQLETSIKAPIAPIVKEVDQEAMKWKPIAIGFGVGGGCLLSCLVVALFIIRSHHKMLVALLKERSI